ncbi:unnamed protein product [Rotaria socialis]|uniref:Myb/SANT-like DNA-binding domain-containing protein n=1 Tax=Rotaria socialis TaxID=392032 RepID=A0A819UUW0_9BILA|nr:unnamed protein product [Rotaria socialis]CAF3381153.1 unnamed protein product [Rotaria socialis]CAF4094389.1 unnamed protein product [Rotaria socialis]CAF4516916.1 unnamed protein product [Rotaria socialis]
MPRGISWSFNETEALIRIWADSATQTALRLNSRNRCIYEDIANQLQAIGITRTADQCQMRIKLLKKMYRQTNEAIKRGDVFQQRPCPFFNEMHRIFSGVEDLNGSSVLSNSQSLLKDDDKEEEEEEEEICDDEDSEAIIAKVEQENENHIPLEDSTNDTLAQAIDRLVQYQQQNEARWYKYLEQQANLELQRRQEDRAYQLQLIQLLSSVISTKTNSSPYPVLQQLLMNNNSQTEKILPQQDNNPSNRGEKRKSSLTPSEDEKKSKTRTPLPSNFYSLLAQIHNINNMDDSS